MCYTTYFTLIEFLQLVTTLLCVVYIFMRTCLSKTVFPFLFILQQYIKIDTEVNFNFLKYTKFYDLVYSISDL